MAISNTRWKGKMPSFNQFLNESKKYDENGLLLEGEEFAEGEEVEEDTELGMDDDMDECGDTSEGMYEDSDLDEEFGADEEGDGNGEDVEECGVTQGEECVEESEEGDSDLDIDEMLKF